MVDSNFLAPHINNQDLWEQLLASLGDVYDAHGICATASPEIARFSNTKTIIAFGDTSLNHYDVWVADPSGLLDQTRWVKGKESLDLMGQYSLPQTIKKMTHPPSELLLNELWQIPHDSILVVPLRFSISNIDSAVQGLLILIDPQPNCPLNEDNINSIATQIVIFLERALLRQRSDQQGIEFGIISDISYSITATLDLEEIFIEVTDSIRRALGVESISIGLIDFNNKDIVFVPNLMGPLFRKFSPIRIGIGQGVAGWVALNGKPTIVNNPYDDNRFFRKIDQLSGFQTNSLLCVPLMAEQKVIGVLEAVNKYNSHFDNHDLRLLQSISGPLAVAIDNARLHADVVAAKRRVETIFAGMSEGLLTVNTDGWVTAANDALRTMLRMEDNSVVGHKVGEVINIFPKKFDAFFNQILQSGQEFPQLAGDLIVGENESVPVLISGTTIQSENLDTSELIFVFSDLRQIREVERMRDDFFNNIVHELHTPLATVLMYARLIRKGKTEGDIQKTQRFLGVIERETNRLQKMVQQMLQLAKLEAKELRRSSERTNLNTLFNQLLPPLADRAIEKGLAFRENIQEGIPYVNGDPDIIFMIFNNLLENSIKFTFSGTVGIDVKAENRLVRIDIIDDGIGISEESIPNLFLRFYRTKNAVERGIAGTGLGLYMVKEGLESCNGTIDVVSKEGKGTTFVVRLPIAGS